MSERVYIAGPMTGIEHFNFGRFDAARNWLSQIVDEVFSPADQDRKLLGKEKDWIPEESDSIGPWKQWSIPNAPSLRTMLGADLNYITQHATAIYMLKGWEKSNGARAEHATAVALGLKISYE